VKHTHSDRLERWLGREAVSEMSAAMQHWYGPPIAVHGVPGAVYAVKGGDFVGEIRAGHEVSAMERARDVFGRVRRVGLARAGLSRRQLGAIGSLDTLIANYTGGKGENAFFQKAGTAANAVGGSMSLFRLGNMPAAGAAAAAAPGGTVPTVATTGALSIANPANANTNHFVFGQVLPSLANTLLLYDRIFAVLKAMNSNVAQAVTGVPTRYQSGVATNEDYIGGNFVFPEIGTVLPATAHNHTVCQYTDQGSNAAQVIPSIAGISAGAANAVDLPPFNWFMPLAAGDDGIKALTQIQTSAAVATGTIDFVMGHPISFLPCPLVSLMNDTDGVYTAFNLTRIYDNACLTFMEMPKPAATATTYTGLIRSCAE
jgi:hypothetical protein